MVGGDAALVVPLVGRVGVAVVAVVGQDVAALASTIQQARARVGGVAHVKGRLVPLSIVPRLVDVDLAVDGPVLTVGPAGMR